MAALRWSWSRSEIRTSVMVREETRLNRRWESHNENCHDGDTCYLTLLETVMMRHVQFHIVPRFQTEIVPLTMPVK
jgi:hypothetical protein